MAHAPTEGHSRQTRTRRTLLAVLLPVPFFVAGHPYDVWGQVEVGAFAVVAGWLAWRTGGLEAPIALHVVNNLVLGLAAASGLADLVTTAGSPSSLVVSTLVTVLAGAWMLRAFRSSGLARTGAVDGSVGRGQRPGQPVADLPPVAQPHHG